MISGPNCNRVFTYPLFPIFLQAELSAKAKETSDYADRLVQRQKELEEEKRRRKAAEDMYMKVRKMHTLSIGCSIVCDPILPFTCA